MSHYTEFEGKSVEKALESASQTLNLAVEKLNYDIVSYGSSGIFGLVGVKKAKIRVTTVDQSGSSQIQKEARSHARDLVKDAFRETARDTTKTARDTTKTTRDTTKTTRDTTKATRDTTKATWDTTKANKTTAIDESATDVDKPDLGPAVDLGCQALQRMVDLISEGARVEAEQQNGRVTFNVEGGNSGLLIGKRGQTLEALQFLLEKIVNKQNDSRIRVLVDVEGYLSARKTNLQRLATKMAEKAQKTNKPVTIGQMNAYDRRIVHLHLKDKQGVRTQSVGEGYYRKLIIFPKRQRGKGAN